MDPVLVLAEWWWVAPAVAGGGAATWFGVRQRRRRAFSRRMTRGAARRIELDAALHDLQQAQDAAVRARAEVQAAGAEVARLQARQTGPAEALAGARHRVQIAQREVKATGAEVRARRAAVKAARATLPAWNCADEALPLARLMATHDAVLSRWMAYETDAALAISYPTMTDAHAPALIPFLREQRLAAQLRPSSPRARTTPAAYAAYRDAVRRLGHAFDAAELDARRRAGESVPSAADGVADAVADAWNGIAQGLADGAQRAFRSSMDALRDRGRRPRP